MRAGLYARVSREEQTQGYSLDAQAEAMRAFCEARGWEIAAEYVEPGFTATTDDRPVFGRVMADAERGVFDVLVTHKMDRAFRNLLDQLQSLKRLERWGVSYASAVEQFDYSTPSGRLFMSQLGALNQYFSDNLAAEVRKGKRGRARAGKSNRSLVSYGYRAVLDGIDAPDPETAPAVVLAFETYADGQHTYQAVADLLNARGYPTYGRAWKGKEPTLHWTHSAVRNVLTNPFYAGWVRHDGELYQGQHEPLISQDLWDRVQEVRVMRSRPGWGGRHSKGVYLLHGVATCAFCGGKMHMAKLPNRQGGHYFYYRCPALANDKECEVKGQSVRQDVIDAQVDGLIRRLVLPPDWRERLEELAGDREARRERADRRRKLEGKLGRLRELYVEGDVDKADYDRQRAHLQQQLDDLQEPETGDVEAAGEVLANLAEVWAGAPVRLRRDMLRTVLEAAVVDVTTGRLVCVKPWPVFDRLFRLDGLQEKDGCFYVKENEQTGPKGRSVSEADSGSPAPGASQAPGNCT